ncbi:MAG: ice-binding family protein [Bacteroidales bacterium]
MPYDIELLYPAQFGHDLVLTPHTYLLNAATTFTDTLFLNAQGNATAVFVIKINGALSTNTYSKVALINGTQAKNVYWKVDGAVSINDYSLFRGTIVCNNGAILLKSGVRLEGRAFTTTGALSVSAITAIMPAGCGGTTSPLITTQPSDQTVCTGSSASFSVAATGTGITYRWRRGILNLSNGGNVTGANSSTLTINPVGALDAASNYNVVITGTFLPVANSNGVELVVKPLPVPTIGSTNNPCLSSINNIYYTESGMTGYVWSVSAGGTIASGQGTSTLNVSWTQQGYQSVSVNYVSVSGCPGGAPVVYTLFVSAPPVAAGIISGSTSMCPGTTGVAYSTTPVSGAESYVWIVPAGATIVSGAGTAHVMVDFGFTPVTGNVMVAGTNQCGAGPSSTLAVTVHPVPAAAVVTAVGTLLTSSSLAGNQWFYNGNLIPGANAQTYSVSGNTGYYWSTVTLNTCTSEISNKVWVEMVGIEEAVQVASFAIYPVPNNGQFTLSIHSPLDDIFTITIYNQLGAKLLELQDVRTTGGVYKSQIDLSTVNAGIYFVLFMNSEQKAVRKFYVNK